MKLSTLLLLIVLGFIGFALWKQADWSLPAFAEPTPSPAPQVAAKGAPPPSASAPPRRPSPPESALLRTFIDEAGEERGRVAYAEYLQKITQFEVHGTVRRHLADGHVYVTGFITDPKTRSGTRQELVLFGLPNASGMADGDIFDCFACPAEPMKMADGSMIREFIYADPAGRGISQFERSVYR